MVKHLHLTQKTWALLTGPTKTCRSTRNTRTASGAIELLLKAAETQEAQGTQT